MIRKILGISKQEIPRVNKESLVVDGPTVVVTSIANRDFLGRDSELLKLLYLVLVVIGFSIFYEIALLEIKVLHLTTLTVGERNGA